MKAVMCDITTLAVDCIVNAANKTLLGGGGVDGAIHRAAGPELLEECRTIGGCPTGKAVLTGGYHLPAKYVIHTVGPVYGYTPHPKEHLKSCYTECMNLFKEHGFHSIAFPAISTGIYGYPAKEATQIAVDTVNAWCMDNPDYPAEIIFACVDEDIFEWYQKFITE